MSNAAWLLNFVMILGLVVMVFLAFSRFGQIQSFDAYGNGYLEPADADRVATAGVDRRRAGGAPASAEQVGADDEEAVGVDRPARPNQQVPPAGALGISVVAGGVRVAGWSNHCYSYNR